MSQFQIHTSKNEVLTLKQLDAEAASFWGKKMNEKEWANPFEETGNPMKDAMSASLNWIDIIGYSIARKPVNNWNEVINNMTSDPESEGYRPFIELIQYWKDKGYKPVTL